MSASSRGCTLIGSGSVGESGPLAIVSHVVNGPTEKIIIVRHATSNLCPNTGVIAMILVNGSLAASGPLTLAPSSVQTSAQPGSLVTIVVHTFPLNNGVVCIRLGQLNFTVDECELEALAPGVSSAPQVQASTAPSAEKRDPSTSDWYAWNNLMPVGPVNFHLRGKVHFNHPDMDAALAPRVPQGIDPRILLIDLVIANHPGQPLLVKDVSYDKTNVAYNSVNIFHAGHLLVSIPVNDVF